jgi:multimeric flavodoxin WrbA
MEVVFLLGSSRSDGNTKKAVDRILYDCRSKVIDLNDLNITPFDYDHKNTEDDFESTVELLID